MYTHAYLPNSEKTKEATHAPRPEKGGAGGSAQEYQAKKKHRKASPRLPSGRSLGWTGSGVPSSARQGEYFMRANVKVTGGR